MRFGRWTGMFAALCLLASPAWAGDDAAVFKKIIEARLAALKRGDAAAIVAMLDPGYVTISDLGVRRTHAEMAAYLATMSNPTIDYTVDKVHADIAGDYAFVDAEVREDMVDAVNGWRESDVFVRRDGRWLYLRRQETAMPHAPQAVSVPGDRLEDYVGEYRTQKGTRDIIGLTDGVLTGRSAPEDAPTALIQVGPGAFAVPGATDLAVFTRDRRGAVTGFVSHLPTGQVVPSYRVAR
jgi:uncharacterized protein YchJ